MSTRLQIIVQDGLDRRLRKAAQRSRLSTSAWVRQAIERALADDRPAPDPLERLSCVGAPTSDIDQMLAEIEAGRG
jgi:predicted transcriptional regulator